MLLLVEAGKKDDSLLFKSYHDDQNTNSGQTPWSQQRGPGLSLGRFEGFNLCASSP